MMENLKKVSRTQWCLFALFIGFAFLMQNCQDDDALIYEENQTETELNARPVSGKVEVCRLNRKGDYIVVSVVAKRVLPTDVVLDFDGDGYVNANSCNVTGLGIDCDDANSEITRITSYRDVDGDGFGNPLDFVIDCTIPSGCVIDNTDCDDTNPAITRNTYYADNDGDGFGNPLEYIFGCSLPAGYVIDNTDCDDTSTGINPGAIEICGDGLDNNCDGELDEGCTVEPRTFVPDNNFEQALINLHLDDVLDDYVDTANINTVTSISLGYKGINDLTGIGGFAALENLNCGSNNLTILDLSQNTALITLVCANNYLTSIDVSNSANLDHLDCNGNLLAGLNLSANTALTYLACTENLLTELDMSANTALLDLQCNLNSLVNLNISNCLALEYLYYDDNYLPSLDLTNNAALLVLTCSNNNIISINVNHLTALNEFTCNDNLLTSLDVSANIYLTRLYCYNNYPSLTCIKVNSDQLATAPGNIDWWKDWDTIYSLDCPS